MYWMLDEEGSPQNVPSSHVFMFNTQAREGFVNLTGMEDVT